MMLVDQVQIQVKAGTGGNGASTFHREKYITRGGPDGGDGGRGGSVYLLADSGLTTLLDFRYHHHYKATSGGHGQRSTKKGADGVDLTLKVPVGTIVKDRATGTVLFDLVEHGQRALVAAGGRGGRGNSRFASAVNQSPRFCENGEPGQERELELELKMLADVGLVGLPNAGKSSLLDRISAAHPKIGDYPFTTLEPVLGVVSLGDHRSCIIADIPGLIEGAHEGLGLGHQFLRHIERTRALVHVLDSTGGETGDALRNFEIIGNELNKYNPELAHLPSIVALNKVDIAAEDVVRELQAELESRGEEVLPISAATGQGIESLLYRIGAVLAEHVTASPTPSQQPQEVVIEGPPAARPSRRWEIERDPDGAWRVAGAGLERLVAMTNVDNDAALDRLHRTLTRAGVITALRRKGVQHGDPVRIRSTEFQFVDEDRELPPARKTRAERSRRA